MEHDLQRVDTGVAERAPNATATQTVPPSAAPPSAVPRELPDSKLNPEAKPLRHLRAFSNYMSPRLGLFSADSWTIGSLYLRNLLLNLLVLVPLLALALATPRLFSWGLTESRFLDPPVFPWLAAISLTIGFGYIGWRRPVEHTETRGKKRIPLRADSRFLFVCVLPLVVAAGSFALFWARVTDPAKPDGALLAATSTLVAAAVAIIGMTLVPFLLYYVRLVRSAAAARRSGFLGGTSFLRHLFMKAATELLAVSVALATSATLLLLLALQTRISERRSGVGKRVSTPHG